MRKAQKEEVLKCIDSLRQAHEEIQTAFKQTEKNRVQAMLEECQKFAISVGEFIEKQEGEGHTTVSCLEEYCETLFCIFEELENDRIDGGKTDKLLKKNLLRIENSIKKDIPIIKEIAFFPYKASMWDSLESIYFAAKEDPNSEAYCVPIPYFDLNPDHSFGEMHYEGGDYPSNVEVMDWKTYHFEKRKPDEMYIHNPYDDWNLVTSVHPRFYASNLKKYTEKLIYIPYFVIGELKPTEQTAIDRIKHFCFLPGVIHADKVIVESENVKKIYVNEYLKAAKEAGLAGVCHTRNYLEKKIEGSGSPKYQKALSMKKDTADIPQEWLNIIQKKDGSWKKIVFFNTGVKTLLDNGEKVLNKVQTALAVFRKEKENIALIWRPHPLVESTLKAMRPVLLEKYKNIVRIYQADGWGIYDDTADMSRTVAISDAYYGDASSIIQLYKKIGKPVLITDYTL